MYHTRIHKQLFLILVLLGVSSTFAQSQEKWRSMGGLNTPRIYGDAVYLGNNEILVAGGLALGANPVYTQTCEIINIEKPRIVYTASMQNRRAEFPLLLTKDSNAIAVSGVTSEGYELSYSSVVAKMTPSVEIFNHKSHQWQEIGNLLMGRGQHAALFINNTEILVVGGRVLGREKSNDLTASTEIFNIETGKSRRVADYPFPCMGLKMGMTQAGEILALGGNDGTDTSGRLKDVYQYDISQNTWTKVDELSNKGVYWISMVKTQDGRLLLSGGATSYRYSYQDRENKVWVSNGIGFDSLENMQIARCAHAAAVYNSDEVVIAGGITKVADRGYEADTSVEVLNIHTGKITKFQVVSQFEFH